MRYCKCIFAVIAFVVLNSCERMAPDDARPEEVQHYYDGPTQNMIFEVRAESVPTKTTLGNLIRDEDGSLVFPVYWEAGDSVNVYWKDNATVYYRTGTVDVNDKTGESALNIELPAELSQQTVLYAVYPRTTTISLSPSSGEIRVTVPTETGTFKKANVMLARCSSFSDKPVFDFKAACALIKFKTGDHSFNDGKRVSRISLYDGNRAALRGNVSYSFEDDNTITVDAKVFDDQDESNHYVTAPYVDPNTECYVAVFPDYNFANGFIVSYFHQQLAAYATSRFVAGRACIVNIGDIQEQLNKHRNFYFKPVATGSGDASSWANAGDINKFREILKEKTPNSLGYAQRLKLDNTNYHFMEGTYQPAPGVSGNKPFCIECVNTKREDSMPINIYGGYSSADPSVRDPQKYETVFTGNGQYAILAVRDRVTLTLDGITFQDGRWNYADGQPGYVYGTALFLGRANADFAAPVVHVNNCKFIGNRQDTSKSDVYHGGAAINVREGKLYVNGCLFENNYGYNRGGAIRVADSNLSMKNRDAFFNNCIFTGNTCGSGFGEVIWSTTPDCRVAMNNCTIYGNNAAATGIMTLCSPYILTNNTIVESVSSASDHILRMVINASYTGSEAVYANNIIIDQSASNVAMWLEQTAGCEYTLTSGGHNYTSKALTTANVDGFTLNHTTSATDVENITTASFGGWQYDSTNRYYIWNGTYPDGNVSYTASDLVAATKANSKIGDDFYNWLVQIGAIVNGQFTDCRGLLRPAAGVCPGAYDPNAQ